MSVIRLSKVPAMTWQHHARDPRPPTSYAVYLDDVLIGHVSSISKSTVRSRRPSGVILSHYKGFWRGWQADSDHVMVRRHARTRADGVAALVEHWGRMHG